MRTGDKAQQIIDTLAVLMPNVGGPCESKRHLLTSVVHLVMLYGAPTWTPSLRYDRRAFDTLVTIQRRVAIRSIGAYRTVSYDAVTVIARTPPIDLMVIELFEGFEARRFLNRVGTDDEGTPRALQHSRTSETEGRYGR